MSARRHLCRACGIELPPGAEFCEECGAPVGDARAGGAPVPGTPAAGPDTPLCPRCGRATERAADAAERLARPRGAGDGAPESADEETAREELAGLLARPEEPHVFSLFGWTVILLIPFLNVLSLFIAPFTLGLKLFMGVVGLAYVGMAVWYLTGTFVDPFAARDAAMMTGLTAFVLYFVALVHSWRVARRDVEARRLPAWRRSVERWEHLVHCDACRTVFFDDAENAPVPADRAPELVGSAALGEGAGARTPLWLWALMAAVAVAGGRTAVSMAREANAQPEPLAPASPELWEDIEADPVRLDSAGGLHPTGLDEPLLGPGSAAPDTVGPTPPERR